MSRAYRIRVSGSASRVVHLEDRVTTSLELLPVLPRERLSELLAAELERRGFSRDGGVLRRREGDVVLEVELATGAVSARIGTAAELEAERELSVAVRDQNDEREHERANAELSKKLERALDEAARGAQRELTTQLERSLRDIQAELDAVVGRVTADALKEKASSLGEIEELSENRETGELVIKVRL